MHRIQALTASLLLLAFPLAAADPPANPLPQPRQVTYKKVGDHELTLHIYEPPDQDPDTPPRAAIIFFFGGGWVNGSPSQFDLHCRYLASRGMLAATADYRVRSRHNTTPRDAVADAKSAIRWLRANAADLNIDPARIAAGGGSAGGHLAATAGMTEGLDDPADTSPDTSSKPDALVLFNPVYDNGPEGYGHDRVKEWFPLISPAHNISADDPPTIVFLGTEDNLIPVATARRFQAAMEVAGITSKLHLYEGQPHGFFNLDKGGPAIVRDTLLKTDAFLTDQGFLKPPPNPTTLDTLLPP
jgi:acetyl esterase